MSNQEAISILAKIFSGYNLILVIAPIIFNPIVLYICLKSKKLRSISTFKILTVNSIVDILVCLPWNFENFAANFKFYPGYLSLFYCQWITIYLQSTTIIIEGWLVLSISVDRLLSLSFNKWSKSIFINSRPYIYCACLILFFFGLNFPRGYYGGYSVVENGTESIFCYVTPPEISIDWVTIESEIGLYIGFIVPVISLVSVNLMIIWKATRFERVSTTQTADTNLAVIRRKREMTKTILIITFFFALTSLPSNVAIGYFNDELISLRILGQLLYNILIGIQMTYPAFNLFILYFSNKLFAQAVKSIIFRAQSSRESSLNNKNI